MANNNPPVKVYLAAVLTGQGLVNTETTLRGQWDLESAEEANKWFECLTSDTVLTALPTSYAFEYKSVTGGHIASPNFVFKGWFSNSDISDKQEDLMRIQFEHRHGNTFRISGKGLNRIGSYDIHGSATSQGEMGTYAMKLFRVYISGDYSIDDITNGAIEWDDINFFDGEPCDIRTEPADSPDDNGNGARVGGGADDGLDDVVEEVVADGSFGVFNSRGMS